MNSTKNGKSNGSSRNGYFKEVLSQFATAFFHNIVDQAKEIIKTKLKELAQVAKRFATVAFLLLVGVIFMFVGIANFIDSLMQINGVGFLFMGIVLTLAGFIINMYSKK